MYTGVLPVEEGAKCILSLCFKLDGANAANVTCVEPPPKSRAATVLTGFPPILPENPNRNEA